MKTVLLLGGSLNGHRRDVHGVMNTVMSDAGETYRVVPMCSHGEVHWFGVLDGADPLALLIAGYAGHQKLVERGDKSVNQVRAELHARADALVQSHTFDPALIEIAAYGDERANAHLAKTGSFGRFDEPDAVQLARERLAYLGHKP